MINTVPKKEQNGIDSNYYSLGDIPFKHVWERIYGSIKWIMDEFPSSFYENVSEQSEFFIT